MPLDQRPEAGGLRLGVAVLQMQIACLAEGGEVQALVARPRRLDPIVVLLLHQRPAVQREGRLVVGQGAGRVPPRCLAASRAHALLEGLQVDVIAVRRVQEIGPALALNEVPRDVVGMVEEPTQTGDRRMEIPLDHRRPDVHPQGVGETVPCGAVIGGHRQVAEHLDRAPDRPGLRRDLALRVPVHLDRPQEPHRQIGSPPGSRLHPGPTAVRRRGDNRRHPGGRRFQEVGRRVRQRRQKTAEPRVEGHDPQDRRPVIVTGGDLQGLEALRHRATAVALQVTGQGEPQTGLALVVRAAGRGEKCRRLRERPGGPRSGVSAHAHLAQRQQSEGRALGIADGATALRGPRRQGLGLAVVAAQRRQDRLLLRQTVEQVEPPQVRQQGLGPGVALARRLQIAALAVQVSFLLQNVGEQPLEPPLLGDLAGVAEQRRGAAVFAAPRRDARQIQVGGALLRSETRVLRARQDTEALGGAQKVARHGVRQAEVVGDHQDEMIVARLPGAAQGILPEGERLGGAILPVADDRQRVQDAGPQGGVPILDFGQGLQRRLFRARHLADFHEGIGQTLERRGAGVAGDPPGRFAARRQGVFEVTHGGGVVPRQAARFAQERGGDRRPRAPPGKEQRRLAHRSRHAGAQQGLAVTLQQVGDLLHALGRQEVRQRLGEIAAARERAPVAPIERLRSLGAARRPELAAQEVEEQRIVGVVGAAALQGGDEQVPAHQPIEKTAHVEPLQDLAADLGVDGRRRAGAQQELAHLHGLGGQDLFAEVVEDLRFGAREQRLGQVGGAGLEPRRLSQQLQGRDPSARPGVQPFHRLRPRRQAEGVAQQGAGLLGREQQIVSFDQRGGALRQHRLEANLRERAARQDQVDRAGQVGHDPPQRPHAGLGPLQVLHPVEHQHDVSAQRLLRVADEDVRHAFGFLRPAAQGLPQSLAALAELRRVLGHPLHDVAEEDGGVAVRGVERVPDRVLPGLPQEGRQKRRLAVPRSGQDDGDAPLEPGAQAVHEPRAPQMQRTDGVRQQLGGEQRRGASHDDGRRSPTLLISL